MRVLKIPVPMPQPAGEQTVRFTAVVPGLIQQVLSAHVKANGEANIYVRTIPHSGHPTWDTEIEFLLISTGTEFELPFGFRQDDLKFVATLSFFGGQAVYHLFRLG